MKHTKSAVITLEKVREVMSLATADFQATINQYKFLASKTIAKKDLEKYVNLVLGKEEDDGEVTDVRSSTIEKIQCLFETGKGHEYGADTAWNAYNAITEYLTWDKGRTQDNRLHSLWFGAGVNVNQLALEYATKLAEGNL